MQRSLFWSAEIHSASLEVSFYGIRESMAVSRSPATVFYGEQGDSSQNVHIMFINDHFIITLLSRD